MIFDRVDNTNKSISIMICWTVHGIYLCWLNRIWYKLYFLNMIDLLKNNLKNTLHLGNIWGIFRGCFKIQIFLEHML